MNDNKKEFKIDFRIDKLHDSVAQLSSEPTLFTKKIKEMSDEIDKLDRFDDYNYLKVPTQVYEALENSEYGIVHKEYHEQNAENRVIYKHQQEAAKTFLRDLRGFGLLADTVGSGKTYEACLILSEYASRNKLRSLLFIVPSQVLSKWVGVVEMEFGLGKDVIFNYDEFKKTKENVSLKDFIDKLNIEGKDIQNKHFKIPKTPVIISMENFMELDPDFLNLLFDCIVVDEAHHLSEDEKYDEAFKKLSRLLQVKKEANSTYCLLLSATPHSGNLEQMFKLWYFITYEGGNPDDFDASSKNHDKYMDAMRHYKENVCGNATTVMEFIQNQKAFEIENNFRKEFTDYLEQLDDEINSYSDYLSLPIGRKNAIIDDFLSTDGYEFQDKVNKNIAGSYRNKIIKPIMIRKTNHCLQKQKLIHNILFYPTRNDFNKIITLKGLKDESIQVDLSSLYDGKPIKNHYGEFSLTEYVQNNKNNKNYAQAYANFLFDIINSVEEINSNKFFTKRGSNEYYMDTFIASRNTQFGTIDNRILFTNSKVNIFEDKFDALLDILKNKKDNKIIVFFDYGLSRENSVIEKFNDKISTIPSLKDRLMFGVKDNKAKVEQAFKTMDNAILIACDESMTEGIDLQSANVIINFQVTTDPVQMDQRIGRIFRLGQESDVEIYSLADMTSLEGYVLMYYAKIGLLTSNSGDSTIIAGSNSENMVAIRCAKCGSVELISKSDFDYRLKHDELYCHNSECEKTKEKLTEICVHDFKCDDESCGITFQRSGNEEGYECAYSSLGMVANGFCNSGLQYDRTMYCRKICAMSHCNFFDEIDCRALQAFKENKNLDDLQLEVICAMCNNQKCKKVCGGISTGKDAISKCVSSKCHQNVSCKPHVIIFDENWVADCPVCKENGKKKPGKLRPVVSKTFALYVQMLWDFKQDKGSSFCDRLRAESRKVCTIRDILEKSDEGED